MKERFTVKFMEKDLESFDHIKSAHDFIDRMELDDKTLSYYKILDRKRGVLLLFYVLINKSNI